LIVFVCLCVYVCAARKCTYSLSLPLIEGVATWCVSVRESVFVCVCVCMTPAYRHRYSPGLFFWVQQPGVCVWVCVHACVLTVTVIRQRLRTSSSACTCTYSTCSLYTPFTQLLHSFYTALHSFYTAFSVHFTQLCALCRVHFQHIQCIVNQHIRSLLSRHDCYN
jgi:hypothetical protein